MALIGLAIHCRQQKADWISSAMSSMRCRPAQWGLVFLADEMLGYHDVS